MDRLSMKFIWKYEGSRFCRAVLKKNYFINLYYLTYSNATVIKIVIVDKDIQIDQWNRIRVEKLFLTKHSNGGNNGF